MPARRTARDRAISEMIFAADSAGARNERPIAPVAAALPPLPKRKPPAKRNDTERSEVQRPLVNYLRRHLPIGSVVFAITNHARSRQQVFALMRDGMLPGMPDVGVVVPGPCFLAIECKRPNGGALSEGQKHVQSELTALGVPVLSECRSVEQAVEWLISMGVEFR